MMEFICYALLVLCIIAGFKHSTRRAALIALVFVVSNIIGAVDPFGVYSILGNAFISFSELFEIAIPAMENVYTAAMFLSASLHLMIGAFFIVFLSCESGYHRRVLWLTVAAVIVDTFSLILWNKNIDYGVFNVIYNLVALYVIYDRKGRDSGFTIFDTVGHSIFHRLNHRSGGYLWKA